MSLPELHRIRSILATERLFVVVTDAFLTETAQLADVVLPAAMWGEKTGTFTNHDRTVHLSERAIEPPGQARPDMEIFLDYAGRLGLSESDGGPLVPWRTPEECFDRVRAASPGAARATTAGCPTTSCAAAAASSGRATTAQPEGTERLYTDHTFNTDTDYCEDYGHDLVTGAA